MNSTPDPAPRLITERLILTLPPPASAPAVVDFFERNRDHFAPWEPQREEEFYTEPFWHWRLAENLDEFRRGSSLRLFAAAHSDPERVLGVCQFSNIVRGAFEACHLGYAIDHEEEGRGLMSEAVEAGVRFVFDELGLHRVMANYQPSNVRSGRLLARLGFEKEGEARDFLKIAGEWRDHVLTARIRPDEGEAQSSTE